MGFATTSGMSRTTAFALPISGSMRRRRPSRGTELAFKHIIEKCRGRWVSPVHPRQSAF
jgi:hypothetical protein